MEELDTQVSGVRRGGGAMSRRSHDPFVTDDEIESMRISSSDDLAKMQAICDRGIAKARLRAQTEPEWKGCCFSGWIFTTDDYGYEVAKPCPSHKPDWTHPAERSSRSAESQRERNIKRTKEAFGL